MTTFPKISAVFNAKGAVAVFFFAHCVVVSVLPIFLSLYFYKQLTVVSGVTKWHLSWIIYVHVCRMGQ